MTRSLLCLATALIVASFASAETKTYQIDGMTCGSCVKAIKAKVCPIAGIQSCKVSVGQMTLTSDKLDDTAIQNAVASAGTYHVADVKAGEPTTPTAKKKK